MPLIFLILQRPHREVAMLLAVFIPSMAAQVHCRCQQNARKQELWMEGRSALHGERKECWGKSSQV